tara:strand:- start:5731 stop:6105 length:375 start_codon:yes stop_codon:yes gene_type:complete
MQVQAAAKPAVKAVAKTVAKTAIPKALREQVWLRVFGKKYESKCYIRWCTNTISVFDFQTGHDIPESKGGATTLENLYPICARCNQSMGTKSITEWQNLGTTKRRCFPRFTRGWFCGPQRKPSI